MSLFHPLDVHAVSQSTTRKLAADWQAHANFRMCADPFMHPCSLRAYTTVMNASAERLVNVLGKKAKSGEPAEMWRLFGCHVMEVICSTALGCVVVASGRCRCTLLAEVRAETTFTQDAVCSLWTVGRYAGCAWCLQDGRASLAGGH
jgi:hypothetical protein